MVVDVIGRRNRYAPRRTGKKVINSARDREILQWLHRYRYLNSQHLIALVQVKSTKRFVERLGQLFHETKLINRPKVQWRHLDPRCSPLVYEISRSGIAYLEETSGLPDSAVTFSRRSAAARYQQFVHTMQIVDALVCAEIELRQFPDQRFVPVDEILAKAPEATRRAKNPLAIPVTIKPSKAAPHIRSTQQTHIIPDALYGIEYLIQGENRYRFWALECENTSPKRRSNSVHSSLARKHAAYDALINSKAYKSHWGIPNLKLRVSTPPDAKFIKFPVWDL